MGWLGSGGRGDGGDGIRVGRGEVLFSELVSRETRYRYAFEQNIKQIKKWRRPGALGLGVEEGSERYATELAEEYTSR